jgi:sugar phosphate isomerase/epimerase
MAKLGLQLYTIREEASRDFLGTVAKVATIGYAGIEFAGYFGTRARELSKVLVDNNIEAAGTVVSLAVLERGLEASIEYCDIINCPMIVCPWIDENLRNPQGYREIAIRFNRYGKLCNENGIKFLYHIHGYEFADFGGQNGMQILYNHTDPELANFEVDIYWVEHGGMDAVKFLKQYGTRCPYIHFKDMKDKVKMLDTEVGEGILDLAGIIQEGNKYRADWYIVEQEQFDISPMESVAISLRNLRHLLQENRNI